MDWNNVDMDSIPIDKLYGASVVQELLSKLDNSDLESIKIPYIMKNKILMSPGVWNSYFYSSNAIQDAFLKSPWDKKECRSLFLDHEDNRSSEWIGEVVNPHMVGDDLIGDLVIVDKPTAMKLAYGAKMGISPKVSGGEEAGRMVQFQFDNFSVVINPAVKTAYINNAEEKIIPKIKEVETMAETTKEATVENIAAPPQGQADAPPANVKDGPLDTPLKMPSQPFKGPEGQVVKMEETMTDEMIEKIATMVADKLKQKEAYPIPAEAAPKGKEKYKYPEMSDDELSQHFEELSAIMKQKEMKCKPKMEQEMSEEIKKKDELIQTLSERLAKVESKLNEPDKASVKSEELSQSQDVDVGLIGYLRTL